MITFVFPAFLWLLLLLPLVAGLALAAPRRLAPLRFWTGLSMRLLALAALVLALAGTQVVQPVDDLTVVFLMDSSDSVPLSQRARAEAYVQEALTQMPAGHQAGIIVFGERALVERPPGDGKVLGQLATLPGGTQTNIQDAVQLGLALLPAERQRRLVLLSDGGENSGDARAAARLAAAQGAPIDVVPIGGSADGLDAQISGLELPSAAREGQRLRLIVTVESGGGPTPAAPVAARLLVEHMAGQFVGPGGVTPRQTLVDQPVQLTGEAQRFEVTLPPPSPFFNRYVVRLLVEGDARPQNNAAEAFTFVGGQPRVLLIEGAPGAARNVQSALTAARLDVTLTPPAAAPTSLGDLSAYDAVLLVNVARYDLPRRTIDLLPVYVRELGRGLAMIGGDQSFGAGGWRATPVEQALPVEMDLRTEVQQPSVSIVVVIDISGSMGQVEGGFTKVELAAAGAARIAAQLRDNDEITVIPFDNAARGTVGPLPGSRRDEAIERIAAIEAGGAGINAYDALREAARYVRASEKPIRHIFTITDGADTVQQEGARELVAQLRAERVTLSSIAIGDGSDVPFIKDIVQIGGGRFFLTDRAATVPTILTGETQVLIQPFLIEGAFTPARGSFHPIVRDLPAAPPLYGYVATTPRASAQTLMTSERGDPVLAVWQYGLGRSLAWTPDLGGQWARDWVEWPQYQRFVAQMTAWLLPPVDAQRLTLDTRTSGGQLVLAARASAPEGGPATGLRLAGQLLASDGNSVAIALQEVAPGDYRLALRDAPPGAYLVQLVALDAQGEPQSSLTAGAVVPPSNEYRSRGDDPALLAELAQSTGGRVNPDPAAIYAAVGNSTGLVREAALPLLWLALLLLPFDVAVRRLGSVRRQSRPVPRPLRPATAKPGTGSRPTSAAVPGSQSPVSNPQADDPLERMRAAQERARRRARGEE